MNDGLKKMFRAIKVPPFRKPLKRAIFRKNNFIVLTRAIIY